MSKTKFEAGALVFAKVKGYPHWPARVEQAKPGEKYRILFFGTYEVGNVDARNLFHYEEHKEKFAKPNKKRFFAEALHEIKSKPNMMPPVTHEIRSAREKKGPVSKEGPSMSKEEPCEDSKPVEPQKIPKVPRQDKAPAKEPTKKSKTQAPASESSESASEKQPGSQTESDSDSSEEEEEPVKRKPVRPNSPAVEKKEDRREKTESEVIPKKSQEPRKRGRPPTPRSDSPSQNPKAKTLKSEKTKKSVRDERPTKKTKGVSPIVPPESVKSEDSGGSVSGSDGLQEQIDFLKDVEERIVVHLTVDSMCTKKAREAIAELDGVFITAAAIIETPQLLRTLRLVRRFPGDKALASKADFMYNKIKAFMLNVLYNEKPPVLE